ncbi:MAG: DNA-binding transcriptional regulator GbsR (MarR family), partial [Pirellulaceae bacterium]
MSTYVHGFVMHIGEMGCRWGVNRTLLSTISLIWG